jgi:putative ABC transport system substrate-binding protein
MRRRRFIASVAAAACPLGARAQQVAIPLIGFLSVRSPEEASRHAAAFIEGLKTFGYVDGKNVAIAYRWARGRYDELAALVGELIAMRPALIVTTGGIASARAAKAATSSIPILFVASDVERAGLVAKLSAPGGNATGVDFMTGELGAKRLELLTQLVPGAAIVGLLTNPEGEAAAAYTEEVRSAVRASGRRLVVVNASTAGELEESFAVLAKEGARALVVENNAAFDTHRDQLIALAAARRLPAIYHIREFPAAGGLMSYGASLVEGYRQLGIQTGRVLRGAKVADLPVVRPTRFELVINLRTAASLGVTVPPILIAQADEVIE